MSLDSRSMRHTRFASDLALPPPFRGVALREVGDAFMHATRIAPDSGAGMLVHVSRYDVAEFAVVLEPDEPLRTARRALYAGLIALADALAVHAPPEKPISFGWPDAIRIDGGLVGGARLGWPPDSNEDASPSWLVFGAMVRTAAIGVEEPGQHPLAAALETEGFELETVQLLESFARHLMATVDAWQQDGFAAVAGSYLSRVTAATALRREIDDNGDLLICRAGKTSAERRSLVPALATPSWLDPATGDPLL